MVGGGGEEVVSLLVGTSIICLQSDRRCSTIRSRSDSYYAKPPICAHSPT